MPPLDQTARQLEPAPLYVAPAPEMAAPSGRIRPYVQIARIDHWFKNVFMLFGVLLAYFIQPSLIGHSAFLILPFAFLCVCLVASSNYVLNEILDAEFDRFHPDKCSRPIPSGLVKLPIAYAEWLVLVVAGIAGSFYVNTAFGFSATALWIMGIVYNVRPLRTKDVAYLDVITESINNPIRLLLGWFVLIPNIFPPVSLFIAYWMLGAFFMALKRFAEFRRIGDGRRAASYRRSFAYYTEDRLLVSAFFFATIGSIFAGIFTVRYHLELILLLPVAAAFLALYLKIGLRADSPVQHPERLYRERELMLTGGVALALFLVLMFTKIPPLYDIFNVGHANTIPPLWTLGE